jgi:aminobenzoyl-glutamate utilization protein B
MAGKAFLVRAGVFKDTDVTLFTHVSNDLGVAWGASGSERAHVGEFRFEGRAPTRPAARGAARARSTP